jgi:hypothetical protein
MSNELLQLLTPALNTILVAILGIIGREIVKVVPNIISLLVAKIGLTNYQKTKAISWDIWNVVEEHFRINEVIGDTIQAKVTMFQSLIKQKIPGITDAEIETVRQAIAGEFNKDKPAVVQAVENPVQEVQITPQIKYIAPDGTELQPVNNTPSSETMVTH